MSKLSCVKFVNVVGLEDKLKENRPLVVKLGFDPTSPDLHLGHFVALRAARAFQEDGHQVHIIVGGFTASIGDPTGRNKLRPPLTDVQIAENAATYLDQVYKVLDPEKTVIVNNNTWFSEMPAQEMLKLSGQVTLAQMLVRQDFATRFASEQPLHLHELMYPLLQGYDSVMLKADVELGGDDQLFNLQMGRVLQAKAGQAPQATCTVPLLVGLDGERKMSKSYGNHIGIGMSAEEMFGKTMSISDQLMWNWFEVLIGLDPEAHTRLREEHPMEVKKRLALNIVSTFHGVDAAKAARAAFDRKFSQHDYTDLALEAYLLPEDTRLTTMLVKLGAASSQSDAQRKIKGNGVRIDGQTVKEVGLKLTANSEILLCVGKKFAVRVAITREVQSWQ